MSIKLRRMVAYWFMLGIGIALMIMQLIKYYDNTLILSVEELIVSAISVSLMINPLFFLDAINKFINNKYGKNTNG